MLRGNEGAIPGKRLDLKAVGTERRRGAAMPFCESRDRQGERTHRIDSTRRGLLSIRMRAVLEGLAAQMDDSATGCCEGQDSVLPALRPQFPVHEDEETQRYPSYPRFSTDQNLVPLRGHAGFRALLEALRRDWDRWRATL